MRDLLWRRGQLMRTRVERLTPIQRPKSQYTQPEIGKKLAYKANRDRGAARLADPAVQQRLAVDLARIGHDDELLRDVELSILNAAKPRHRNTRSLLRTVPGIGELLSLGLLYEIYDIQRFPRVQERVSSCRLVKCAKASACTRYGTSGTKIGHASQTAR